MQDDQALVKPPGDKPDRQRKDKKKAELAATKERKKIEMMRLFINKADILADHWRSHRVSSKDMLSGICIENACACQSPSWSAASTLVDGRADWPPVRVKP